MGGGNSYSYDGDFSSAFLLVYNSDKRGLSHGQQILKRRRKEAPNFSYLSFFFLYFIPYIKWVLLQSMVVPVALDVLWWPTSSQKDS